MDSGFLIKSLLGMENVSNAQQEVVFDGCVRPPVTGGVSTDSWTIEVKTGRPCVHTHEYKCTKHSMLLLTAEPKNSEENAFEMCSCARAAADKVLG